MPPFDSVSKLSQINLKIEIIDNFDNIYWHNVISKYNKHDNYLVLAEMDAFSLIMNHGQMGVIRPVRISPKLFCLELLIITKSKLAFEFF